MKNSQRSWGTWFGVLSLAWACACKGKEEPSKTAPANAPAQGTAATAGQDPGKLPTGGQPLPGTAAQDRAARCEMPCLLLTEFALSADPARAYCEACGAVKPAACEPDAWPYVPAAAIKSPTAATCDAYDMARNCIFAAYGKQFKKDQWKRAFENASWYRPDPTFTDDKLPKLAQANVQWLLKEKAACSAAVTTTVSPAATKAVEAWFAARATGMPPLPSALYENYEDPSNKLTAAKFKSRWLSGDLFKREPWQPLMVSSVAPESEFAGAEAVLVSTGHPDPAVCTSGEEDCEGFDVITFYVKDGKIVGLLATASACPFVYERRADGGWHYHGEAIANLFSPARETYQALALTVMPAVRAASDAPAAAAGSVVSAGAADGSRECSSTRVFRIVEQKREVSYLDAVALEVDGVRYLPTACASARGGELCADDGRYLTLREGQEVELTFLLAAPSCSAGTLWSDGYYERLQ